jgi:hypothetical protein
VQLLSKEDIEDGGAVFALLIFGCLAWAGVYSVSLILDVHWLVALPIAVMLFNGVRATIAALGRGLDRWADAYAARHPERDRPPKPDGHGMAKAYERLYKRTGPDGVAEFERLGGYEGFKERVEADMQKRLDEWLAAHPPPDPPPSWHRSAVDEIVEKNRAKREELDARRRSRGE